MRSFIYLGLIICLMSSVRAEENPSQGKRQELASQFLQYHDLLTLKLNELNKSLAISDDAKHQLSAKIKEKMNQLDDIRDKIEALSLLYAETEVERGKQEEKTRENDDEDRQSMREEMEYLDDAARKEQTHLQQEIDEFLKGMDQLQKNISSFKTERFAKALEDILMSAMEKVSAFVQKLKDKKQ